MISPRVAQLSSGSIAEIIFAVAVVVRIAFVSIIIGLDHGQESVAILNGDERDYIGRAEHINSGLGLTAGNPHDRMLRMPAYPLWLATIFAIFGRQLVVVRLFQAVLGALVCVLLFGIARRLFDRAVATFAALYFAFYPPHLYMAGQILSENLLLPAVLLATLAFLKMMERPSTQSAVLCGVLAALSMLVKPESGLVAAAIIATIWLIRHEHRLRLSAALVLAIVLVITPWLVRNYRWSGHLMVSSVGGETFWGGNNEHVLNLPKYRGYWMSPANMPDQHRQVLAAPTEYERDRMRWRLGWEFLETHRGDIPRLVFYKLRRFYYVLVQDPKERIALILSFGLLLPFIAAGLAINTRRFLRDRHPGFLLIAIIVVYNLLAVVFWGANRLRLVIDPMLILFGVWAACALVGVIAANIRSIGPSS
jgi:hypothetical protein